MVDIWTVVEMFLHTSGKPPESSDTVFTSVSWHVQHINTCRPLHSIAPGHSARYKLTSGFDLDIRHDTEYHC